MNEDIPTTQITRLREQLLLAQIRLAELEDERSRYESSLKQERQFAEVAQRLADSRLGSPTADSLAAELSLARDRIAELDAERRAMKESLVWRCAAPLRSIQRWLAGWRRK